MIGHKAERDEIDIIDKSLPDFLEKVTVVTLLEKNQLSLISPVEDVIEGVWIHHNGDDTSAGKESNMAPIEFQVFLTTPVYGKPYQSWHHLSDAMTVKL